MQISRKSGSTLPANQQHYIKKCGHDEARRRCGCTKLKSLLTESTPAEVWQVLRGWEYALLLYWRE